MSDSEDTAVESAPPPRVSSLRSRFEKLSTEQESLSPPSRPASTYLDPSCVPGRPRALSNLHQQHAASDNKHLRTSSSSSDLRAHSHSPSGSVSSITSASGLLGKPPPPPPPVNRRTPSPSPSISPLLRPVPNPVSIPSISEPAPQPATTTKSALLSRKPPPPPPHAHGHAKAASENGSVSAGSDGEGIARPGSVASLINQFGSNPPSHLPSPASSDHGHGLPIPPSPKPPPHPPPRPSLSTSPDAYANIPGPAGPPSPQLRPRPPPRPSLTPSDNLLPHSQAPPSPRLHARPAPPPPRPSVTTSDLKGAAHSPSPRPSSHPPPPPRHSAHSVDVVRSNGVSSPSPASRPVPPPRPIATPPDVQVESPFSDSSSSESSETGTSPERLSESTSPPQLPPRHNTHPPPLPRRRETNNNNPHAERLPPPPTRTIALGDKLPPPRRPPTPSSSESEEEEKVDPAGMPDTSRASRRPPSVGLENRVHVPSHSEVAACGRTVVVAHSHRVRVWEVGGGADAVPVWDLDLKDALREWKVKEKEVKVCSVEFLAGRGEEVGCFVWMGTKEGHLIEFDVGAGAVTGVKLSAHSHAVTHIFRIGRAMVSMDESGKVLVFEGQEGAALMLNSVQPRVVRIADKQEFAHVIGGKLWTSARMDPGGGAGANGTSSRGPIVRVYDILTPGSSGRSLLPTEHVGNVTCGTVLPSQPGSAYLGHEGGFISIWCLHDEEGEGVPVCLEVMKISTSDVLCLEGVNDKLWAGGRKGMVAAYDVSAKPWVMTNNWDAHGGVPVTRLAVDPWSIEKLGRLCVVSVGRDERIKFWDGLLAENWIDEELLKREEEFSKFRDLSLLIVSWNVDAAKPDALSGSPENINFLDTVLHTVDSPDIIAFGFQELIDLESRKMAAKSVLLGGKKKTADGTISEKVSSAYKKWYDKLVLAVRLAMPPETPYTVIHTENLVGLFSCIFVKNTEKFSLKDVAITTIKRGMGGRYGNKGGIVARFIIDDTSVCFINCHLAAGQHHVRQRNADVAAMVEEKAVFPATDTWQDPVAYVGGGDGSMVLDHEIVFFNGDMNYRIEQRRDAVIAAVRAGDYDFLIAHDQLVMQMKNNRAFRLRSFREGPLTFPPTYKYDRRSDEYDTSEKRRVPAWCDRVLWRSRHPDRVEQLHYQRYEANVSDHRPISAAFKMTVKSVNRDKRARVKREVQEMWDVREQNLLIAAREFYASQAIIL